MLTRPPYAPLGADTLPDRLGHRPELTRLLGPPAQWRVREVGDGNLNLVFIVEGIGGSLVVKQALPFARVVGKSWPMSLDRAFFEYEASIRLGARDPGRMPKIHLFDREQALQVMEHLTPHIILRRGLIAGTRYRGLGAHLGRFLARTLFRGSDWAMDTAHRKADLAVFAGNVELSGITEDLFFTDPFFDCPRNHHNRHLDADVTAIRSDRALKLAALRLKARFCTVAQTLLHGDLHTGSVMVSEADSRVIDAEFAAYGPIGFDIGSLLANLWMAAFAQAGLRPENADTPAYRQWIRDLAGQIWHVFAEEFSRLWRTERTGILGGHALFEAQGDEEAVEQALTALLDEIWRDTLGFAGLEMHRRVLGLAHIAEFEAIGDEAVRAACERRALRLGRALAVTPQSFADVAAVNALAVELDGDGL